MFTHLGLNSFWQNRIHGLDSDIIHINESGKGTSMLKVTLLDEEDFIKKNHIQEVTDPIFFVKEGIPTEDGLLSNKIFGVTKQERSKTFAYINLEGVYMHPLCYKVWGKMDSRIKDIAHGAKKFIINKDGDFEEDPNGSNGMEFIQKNIDKIKIRSTGSKSRDNKIKFLMRNKEHMFIKKLMVIPAYYRDANSNIGNVGVGALNKHYASILISTKSLRETQEYGLDVSDAVRGRVQETIKEIYNILGGTSDDKDAGIGLYNKRGYIKGAVMSKTADYGSRLIISAPDLKVESLDDMMVNMDYCALPLASAITNFYPFIVFWVKRFFENNFYGNNQYPMINKKGEIEYVAIKDPLETFSDARIKEELKRFVYGYSDRFAPVKIPTTDGREINAVFSGKSVTAEDIKNGNISGASPLIKRDLTWCDIFYMAASEAVKDKHILITRFPMDSCFNQIPSKCRISTIKKTEKVYVNGEYYPFYPKIRQEDISSNTSDLFIDTLMFTNLLLKGFNGDYDGDQVSVKGVWTQEANEELEKFINSTSNYIDLGGSNIRVSTNEAIQSLYCLTKILPSDTDKIEKPVF